jgi:hypothetical protein
MKRVACTRLAETSREADYPVLATAPWTPPRHYPRKDHHADYWLASGCPLSVENPPYGRLRQHEPGNASLTEQVGSRASVLGTARGVNGPNR